MKRIDAFRELSHLIGSDMREVARTHDIETRGISGKVNKGWAGHAIERHLGLDLNSSQAPNFGSWELKVIPLKRLLDGRIVLKETMAVTMIDQVQVSRVNFEDSHLLQKLRRFLVVARIVDSRDVDLPSIIHSVTPINLEGENYETVKNDYEEVQKCINDPHRGFNALTGKMGIYIQPRTKGAGHGSTSRAFYAKKPFLYQYLDL